jgi:hypothetical protein
MKIEPLHMTTEITNQAQCSSVDVNKTTPLSECTMSSTCSRLYVRYPFESKIEAAAKSTLVPTAFISNQVEQYKGSH